MDIYNFDYNNLELCDDISSVNIKSYYIKFKNQFIIKLPSIKSDIQRYHMPYFKFNIKDDNLFNHNHQIIDFFKSIDITINDRPIRNKIYNIMSKYNKMTKYFTFLDYNFIPSNENKQIIKYIQNDSEYEKQLININEYSFKIDDKLIIKCINSKGEIKELDQNYFIPDNVDINYTIRLDGVIVNGDSYKVVYRIIEIDFISDNKIETKNIISENIQRNEFENCYGLSNY